MSHPVITLFAVQIDDCVAQLNSAFDCLEIEAMPGDAASSLLDALLPLSRRLSAVMSALSAQGVRVHQHVAESASSRAAWVASKTGTSETRARSALAIHKELTEHPDLQTAVRSGEISVEAASQIVRNSDGNAQRVKELSVVAQESSFDDLMHHIRKVNAKDTSIERKTRLRKSQFIAVGVDSDSMITGSFRFRPSLGSPLLELARACLASTPWERAETFATRVGAALGGGIGHSGAPRAVFHIDLKTSHNGLDGIGDRFSIRGVGEVDRDEVIGSLEQASRALVGTCDNKLVWFSEQDRRSKSSELPEFIKRAIKAGSRDVCDIPGCNQPANQIDHIVARCNDGIHAIDNLQSLCAPHHAAKTRIDAPWTTTDIYNRQEAESRAGPTLSVSKRAFPDTG